VHPPGLYGAELHDTSSIDVPGFRSARCKARPQKTFRATLIDSAAWLKVSSGPTELRLGGGLYKNILRPANLVLYSRWYSVNTLGTLIQSIGANDRQMVRERGPSCVLENSTCVCTTRHRTQSRLSRADYQRGISPCTGSIVTTIESL
jgi:hypothetical protein